MPVQFSLLDISARFCYNKGIELRRVCDMKSVFTNSAPAAIGPYSQAVCSGNLVYTSGQLGIDPATGDFSGEGVTQQTEQAIQNLSAVLSAANSDLERVVKTTCFLKSMNDFAAFNQVYEKYFPQKPARSCVEVAKLPKNGLVEIEAVAEIGTN